MLAAADYFTGTLILLLIFSFIFVVVIAPRLVVI
jgi:hypothetical protein